MARTTIEERLQKLEQQKRQIEEQARSLRSRVYQERRKIETRQRILLGAFLLHQLERKDAASDTIRKWVLNELPGFLTKQRDKEAMAEIIKAVSESTRPENSDV